MTSTDSTVSVSSDGDSADTLEGSFRFMPVVLSDASEEFEPQVFHSFDVLVIRGQGSQTSDNNGVGSVAAELPLLKKDSTEHSHQNIVDNEIADRGDDPMDIDVAHEEAFVTQNVVVEENISEVNGAITDRGDDLDADVELDNLALSFLEEDGDDEIGVANPFLTGAVPIIKHPTTQKVENSTEKRNDEFLDDMEDDLSMYENPACLYHGQYKHAENSEFIGGEGHNGQRFALLNVVQSEKDVGSLHGRGNTSCTPLQKWEYEQGLPVDGVADVQKWAAEVGLNDAQGSLSDNGKSNKNNRSGSPTKYVQNLALNVINEGDANESGDEDNDDGVEDAEVVKSISDNAGKQEVVEK